VCESRGVTTDLADTVCGNQAYGINFFSLKISQSNLRADVRSVHIGNVFLKDGAELLSCRGPEMLKVSHYADAWLVEPLYLLIIANEKEDNYIDNKNTFCGTRYLSHCCSLHGTVLLSRR